MNRRNLLGLIGGVGLAMPLSQTKVLAAAESGQHDNGREISEQARNKQIVRNYFDRCFNQGDLEFGRRIIAEDYNFHLAMANAPKGFEAWKKGVGMFRSAFPDCHWQVYQIIADADLVSVRTVWTGTHSGPWMGVQATGRRVTAANSDYYRLSGGKFVEHWDVPDYLAILKQIGGTLDQASPMFAGSTD